METSTGLQKIRQTHGLASKIARKLGIQQQAVSKWKRIPAERVIAVEKATGIPRAELRPDLFAQKCEPYGIGCLARGIDGAICQSPKCDC